MQKKQPNKTKQVKKTQHVVEEITEETKEESKENTYERNTEIESYASMMNNLLPPDIRIHGYAVVSPYFDARFSCLYREYKYFFNLKNMDLEKMKVAASKLVGTYDFRNF